MDNPVLLKVDLAWPPQIKKKVGADHFLAKFNPDHLMKAVKDRLETLATNQIQ
jgi:hypothetical protein